MSYHPAPGHWDEAFRPSGVARRHWRQLAAAIGRMGFDHLTRRWQTGQHLIQANGVTYNVYGDPKGKERPWSLDPIPLVLDATEWASLEAAIIQRATLLNRILADLHGPQRLIHDRLIPPALLFANPNFLRPCFGIRQQQDVFLYHYAVDLGRSPDGTWWAITDRTQAPSGVGYALENRLVSARTLPAAFSQSRVMPLNGFFNKFRDSLLELAPGKRVSPRVVLLTPGPNNETYFEQSLLASHWRFPLVEGADLTVRDNRVFLKTLSGLEPVDVIFRRLDDNFCDPLELRNDSLLGVPGLVQAVRSGNVAIANALGSGLLETSTFMSFLPSLSRLLLGEDLRMPSVATWWCGQEGPRRFVKDNLANLVIKPAFPRRGRVPEFPAYMDSAARAELAERMEADPDHYLAQEQVALSTAPVRTNSGFEPRHLVLRVFAAWNGDSYSVMPGGLTRVSTEASSPVVSMQMGGGSKDTWVLGGREDSHAITISPHREWAPKPIALPSRVADNLFWLGRYGERIESGVRTVRALVPGLSGEEDYGQSATLESVVQLLIGLGFLPKEFALASIAQQRWQVGQLLSGLVYDPSRTSGIGWNLNNLRRVAWPAKERLSQDTWRVLQQLETVFSSTPSVNPDTRMVAQMNLLDRAIVILSAFSGLVMENTTRSSGWLFLDIGRRLERAIQMLELISASLAAEPAHLEASLRTLLQIADSSITYHNRYLTDLKVESVLELLLQDQTNPRSVGFQLFKLVDHLRSLPANPAAASDQTSPEAIVELMIRSIDQANLAELCQRDEADNLAALEELTRHLKGGLYDVSEQLTALYFSHLSISRLLPTL